MLELAEKMIKEGKGEELMPRDASPEAPITANRYCLQINFALVFTLNIQELVVSFLYSNSLIQILFSIWLQVPLTKCIHGR